MTKPILVLGATGNVGAPLVQNLLAKGQPVRAASRSGRDIGAAKGVRFEYDDPSTFDAAFDGAGAVYLLLPHGMDDIERRLKTFIDLAAARGAKIVLQSIAGVSPESEYGRVEQHLRQSGARFVILGPGWFADTFHVFLAEEVKHGAFTLPARDGAVAFIDCRDIAACAAVALTSDAFDGRKLQLSGPAAITMNQAAALLSKATGRTIAYNDVPADAFFQSLLSYGMPRPAAEQFAAAVRAVADGHLANVYDGVPAMTGAAPRPFETYAQTHADKFRA